MSVAALVLAWLAGWPWVRASRIACWVSPRAASLALEASFAFAFGLGSTATLFVALLWTGFEPRPAAFSADGFVLTAGLMLVAWRRKHAGPPPGGQLSPGDVRYGLFAPIAFSFCLIAFMAAGITYARANPQGHWDALAIWNLRAKFLANSHTWRNAVSPAIALSHPEYPLLWPAAIARPWAETGSSPQIVPVSASLLASCGVVILFAASLTALRGWVLGCLGGCVLLSFVPLWLQMPAQYADVPLALFILAATASALFASLQGLSPAALLLSGALASFAGFTKNEGLVFCAIAGATTLAVAPKRFAFWMLGAGPTLILVGAFRVFLAPAAHVIETRNLGDFGRLVAVLRAFASELWHSGGLLAHPLLLVAVLFLFWGRCRPLCPVWPVVAVAGLLITDLVVLWGTPNDLQWQLDTALQRLIVQVFPAILWCLLLWVRQPASSPVAEFRP